MEDGADRRPRASAPRQLMRNSRAKRPRRRTRPFARPSPGSGDPGDDRRRISGRTGPWPSTAAVPGGRPASCPPSARAIMKTAWRKMKRQKGYAFINVASLAVGLAGALFIWLWVQDELSFDRFHANAPALFRVEQDQIGGQGTFHVYVTQYPDGPGHPGRHPRDQDVGPLCPGAGAAHPLRREGLLREPGPGRRSGLPRRPSPSPCVRGDRTERPRRTRPSIVLTEEMAVKYFGAEDPIGKTLVVNNVHSLAVTGVARNVPANSTIGFDMLVPFEFLRSLGVRHRRAGDPTASSPASSFKDPGAAAAVGEKITQLHDRTRFFASGQGQSRSPGRGAQERPAAPVHAHAPHRHPAQSGLRVRPVHRDAPERQELLADRPARPPHRLHQFHEPGHGPGGRTGQGGRAAQGFRRAARATSSRQFYGESGLTTVLALARGPRSPWPPSGRPSTPWRASRSRSPLSSPRLSSLGSWPRRP
ncbi:MAG: ABC transporter permease [Candidatus Moduliflexus flocculans]|nr:ABC transporter permease [Candidatus Moduliflexus flocculans]